MLDNKGFELRHDMKVWNVTEGETLNLKARESIG